MKTMVVIPTYNEVSNLNELVSRILKLEVSALEILIVDDGSPDGTPELVEKLAAVNLSRCIHLLKRLKKHGLGPAYVAGFREALKLGADQIIQMDADLSHSPEYIPEFLKRLQDYDVVVGSRYISGGQTDKSWPKRRRFLSSCGNFYMRVVSGVRLRDPRSGFKGFRREVLEAVKLETLQSKGFVFQTELASRCQRLGYKVIETPILFHDREGGRSKMSLGIIIEALWRILLIHWYTRRL